MDWLRATEKKIKIDYNYLLDINKVQDMYNSIKKHTKHKEKLAKYGLFLGTNLNKIIWTLKDENYVHNKYNIFTIYEPKERIIMSENLPDKIINQLTSEYALLPLLEPKLLDCNVATRKNKGSSHAMKLLKKYINKMKFNHEKIYVLKCDISKYFYSIDHNILKQMLIKDIKDKKIYKLIEGIIDSTNNTGIYEYDKGLAIGNQTSQVLAIYYLNGLDHYIKEKLGIKGYIRYMDDFILLHKDKEYLKKCREEIEKYLDTLKLKLNKKTCILELHKGLNFLGYKYILDKKRLIIKINTRTKYRIRKRIKKGESTYKNYYGFLKHSNVKLYKKADLK